MNCCFAQMSLPPPNHPEPHKHAVLRWGALLATSVVILTRKFWHQSDRFNAAYKLMLLVIAVGAAWLLDIKQSNFADIYIKELLSARQELHLESFDMNGDHAYANLEISLEAYPDAASEKNIQSLASSLTNIYCTHVRTAQELEIPLFHVNIRATDNGESRFILSRAFSKESCT